MRGLPSCIHTLVTPIVLRWAAQPARKLAARGVHAAATPSLRGLYCSSSVRRQRRREFRPEFTYVYFTRLLERAIEGRSGVSRGDGFWGISLNFQHRFGRRPRRRVGIDRVAIASSAWRKLCSSSLVETVVGVSDASSSRATAVATHSSSVARSFMVRPGAGGLRGRNLRALRAARPILASLGRVRARAAPAGWR